MKNRKTKALCITAAAIFLVSAAACIYLLTRPKSCVVEIISGGEVLYTLDLSKEPDRDIVVEYEGRRNVIRIEDHDIFMLEAECPDHTCIRTGRLSKSGVPIVCLPNKLMIRRKTDGGLDAAV